MPTGRPYPMWVCWQCGDKAQPHKTRTHILATYHVGICDVCKERKPVTQPRDFGYPDFETYYQDTPQEGE